MSAYRFHKKESDGSYVVRRHVDDLFLGIVWRDSGGFSSREGAFRTREDAARSIDPGFTKRERVSLCISAGEAGSGRDLVVAFDVDVDQVEKLDPASISHGAISLVIGKNVISGHVWTVPKEQSA